MNDEPVTILCVLFRAKEWAGGCGEYGPSWVEKLYRGIARNTTRPFDFACLTDFPRSFFSSDIRTVEYADHRNVGNWLGITEVMRPEIGNRRRVVLGLDSVIVGNVDWLLDYRGDFGMPKAHEFATPRMKNDHVCNAVTAWDVDAGVHLWERLRDDRDAVARDHVAHWSRGVPSEMVYWREAVDNFDVLDDLYPGQLISYRIDYKRDRSTIDGASIVYFHGATKPHRPDVPEEIRRHWA